MNQPDNRLSGVFLPVTTPFDPVTGDVAPVSFRENLRRWSEESIDGVVLFGSTGEGALLDEDEKVRLTEFAREVVPTGIAVMAGASAESTRATIRQTKELAAAGAECMLTHAPWYFGPHLPVAALLDHYRAVADASPVPVLVYHMPKFTNVVIDPGLMGELLRHPNIAGLKDSSGDIKRFADYTDVAPDGKALFVGNGTLLYTALELGGAGGILAVADFAPADCVEIARAFREGDTARAGRIQERIAKAHREIVGAWGAVGVKAALDELGWAGGPPRPPLRSLGDADRKKLAGVLRKTGILAAARA